MISSSLSTDWKHCYDTGNFTANSTYARNGNLLLSSLASNITGYKGFYNTTIGQDPDKVYARKKHYCGLGILRALYTMQTALILEKWRWILQILIMQAWEKWNEGTASNLIDPTLRGGSRNEMLKCVHIGLLCVQESVSDRHNHGFSYSHA
ncbi:hypothetical protein JRO89_XS06G0098300 [Xanthoceras sorbifolium]|uniref:Gnk2-homologous domain-containing protein n=1 Tax=Xanthoceras sorbifolium TaxID=99658 RepID=A0ABQ8HXI6_9ROSI|nr:hypothetical protein JRO89_XS06G0098300 [Xanthoceras sorbifolium]